jgi:hypothetical protein
LSSPLSEIRLPMEVLFVVRPKKQEFFSGIYQRSVSDVYLVGGQ